MLRSSAAVGGGEAGNRTPCKDFFFSPEFGVDSEGT